MQGFSLSRARIRQLALALLAAGLWCLLLLHAAHFDFFCDDAYIALRYSKNLLELGALVYNPGERVEGYTSFLWTVLVAGGGALGLPLVTSARLVGALAAGALLILVGAVWSEVQPRRLWDQLLLGASLVISTPIVVWTLGGLEAVLFAALGIATVLAALRFIDAPTLSRGFGFGLCATLATLTRPEAALLVGCSALSLGASTARDRNAWRALGCGLACYLALVAIHVSWRWWYYGWPLPNTFYVKTSGFASALWRRGWLYLEAFAREQSPLLLALAALGFAWPQRRTYDEATGETQRKRRFVSWLGLLYAGSFTLYLARIGGDFLDLYRFLVPLLPFIYLGVGFFLVNLSALLRHLLDRRRLKRWVPALVTLALAGTLFTHASHQYRLGERALAGERPRQPERLRVERLTWTKAQVGRWAAAGHFLRSHAQPGDTLAVGAAGAMPFYSELPTLDLHGLSDEYVAHHGEPGSARPGHQRFAPMAHIVKWNPTFLILTLGVSDELNKPRNNRRWNPLGYVEAVAKLDGPAYGLDKDAYFTFLVREPRAHDLEELGTVKVAWH